MYFAKLGKEMVICAASREFAFAPKGCSRLPFMGRKSFLCDAAAGKVKAERLCWREQIAFDTYHGREGGQQRAHRARHRPVRIAGEGEDEPVA